MAPSRSRFCRLEFQRLEPLKSLRRDSKLPFADHERSFHEDQASDALGRVRDLDVLVHEQLIRSLGGKCPIWVFRLRKDTGDQHLVDVGNVGAEVIKELPENLWHLAIS